MKGHEMLSIDQLRNFAGSGAISISHNADVQGGPVIRNTGVLHSIKTFFGFKSAKATNQATLDAVRNAIRSDPQLSLGHKRADELLNSIKGTITIEKVRDIITTVRLTVDGMSSSDKMRSIREVIQDRVEARPMSEWPDWAKDSVDTGHLRDWSDLIAQTIVSREEPKDGWGSLNLSAAIKEVDDTLGAAFEAVKGNGGGRILAHLAFDRGINMLSNSQGALRPKDECVKIAKEVKTLLDTADRLLPDDNSSYRARVVHVARKSISQMKVLVSPELFTKLARLGLELDPNPLSDIRSSTPLDAIKARMKEFNQLVVKKLNEARTEEMQRILGEVAGGEVVAELQAIVIDMAVAGMDPDEQEFLRMALNKSETLDFMDNGATEAEDVNQQITMQMVDQTLNEIGLSRNYVNPRYWMDGEN